MIKICAFFYLSLLTTNAIVYSQNLIKNGSFEEHGNISCLSCDMVYGKFPSMVYYWDNMNTAGILCDESYNQTSDEKLWGHCPFEKIKAQDGESMMMQNYLPGAGKNGQATYLISQTIEPLIVGENYEASLWIFIPDKGGIDPDLDKHLGVAFLPGKFIPKDRGLFKVPALKKDTIERNKWVQLKWHFSPMCSANYFLIGIFKTDSWPKSRSFQSTKYFIDNVNLKKISGNKDLNGIQFGKYCSRYEIEKDENLVQKFDDLIIHFDSGSCSLNDTEKNNLDSFAQLIRKHPEIVFEITGHTDTIGILNTKLSQNRAQEVFSYLVNHQKIPEFRFVVNALGSTNPAQPNYLSEGRKLNRRVEIHQSELDISMIFYRNAIQQLKAKNKKEVYSYLKKWLNSASDDQKILLLFDPRFNEMEKEKGWHFITNEIKLTYNSFQNPNYAFWLDSLRLDNLKMRGLTTKLNNIIGPTNGIDSSMILPYPNDENMAIQDMAHLKLILATLEKKGWPKISEVGKNAASAPFFIFQHAADSVIFSKWLPVLKSRCVEGEAEWGQYAMMYDRYNMDIGKPQKYGTNVEVINGKLVIRLEDDIEKTNENRIKIGLPLLSPAEINIIKKSN